MNLPTDEEVREAVLKVKGLENGITAKVGELQSVRSLTMTTMLLAAVAGPSITISTMVAIALLTGIEIEEQRALKAMTAEPKEESNAG